MTDMGRHHHRMEIDGVPEGEDIDPGDVAERVDENPEDQENRVDPVWSENSADEEHPPRH